jgi:hypothetical protein
MSTRSKFRLKTIAERNGSSFYRVFGRMRGTVKILGDIVGPVWDDGPWDAELGIAYRGENGEPVYYTGNGTETTDDLP